MKTNNYPDDPENGNRKPSIPPDPAKPGDVWEVADGPFIFDLPPRRSLEAIRLDLKQKRIARRRRQQERELVRETELRRQMIARRKEWDDAR